LPQNTITTGRSSDIGIITSFHSTIQKHNYLDHGVAQ
jgi:hypothetical protein